MMTNEEKLELAKECGFTTNLHGEIFPAGDDYGDHPVTTELEAYTSAIEQKRDEERDSYSNMQDIAIKQYQAQIAMLLSLFRSANTAWGMGGAYDPSWIDKAESATQPTADAFIAEVKAGVWSKASEICTAHVAMMEEGAEHADQSNDRTGGKDRYYARARTAQYLADEFSRYAAELHNSTQAEGKDGK